MLFNSVPFLMFFPAVLLVHFVLPRRARWIWLLVASYYFYMCWNPAYGAPDAHLHRRNLSQRFAHCPLPCSGGKTRSGKRTVASSQDMGGVEPDHQPGHSVLLQVLPLCSGKPNGAAVEYGD